MMPLSTAQRGKLHGNISRSQQTLLSSLSPPCPPSTAAQRGILTAGGSHQRPLASSLYQPPDSQLFSGTLHALQRRKIPGICLGLWEPLASFLLRKQLESCPQKLICKMHSLQNFYQLAHFKQVLQRDGRPGLDERTGSTPLPMPGTRSSDPSHSSQSPQ